MSAAEYLQGIEVLRLTETASTNDAARSLAQGRSHRRPLLVVARHQRAGRGRGDHTWYSSPGDDLLLSLLWYPSRLPAARQFALSLAAALATARLARSYTQEVAVKWPNDILVAGRKIAGILIENTVRHEMIDSAIIGIGFNVNNTSFPPSLPAATSLRIATGKRHDPPEVLDRLVLLLKEYLNRAEKDRNALQEEYESLLYRRGEESAFRTATGVITATLTGIDRWGRLLLTLPDGNTRACDIDDVHQIS